jgi:hypothetical protein
MDNSPQTIKQKKQIPGLILFVLWMALPGLMVLVPTQLIYYFIFFPFAGIALLLCLEILTVRYYLLTKKTNDAILYLILGLIVQLFFLGAVSIYRIPTIPAVADLLFIAWPFALYVVMPQLVVVVLASILKFKQPVNQKLWLRWVAVGVVVLGVAWSAFQYIQMRTASNKAKEVAKESAFDNFSLAYRGNDKAQTILGQLPRPLRILYKDGIFIGVKASGETVSIPVSGVTIDKYTEVLFDVYGDRVFYVNQGKLYYYDVKKKQVVPVINNGKTFIVPPNQKLSGVFNNDLSLETMGGYAGTNDVSVYDLNTGNKISTSTVAGYDVTRAYAFSVDNKPYQLVINSKGKPASGPALGKPGYTRIVQTQDSMMSFYLNDASSPNYVLPRENDGKGLGDNAVINTWEDIVFTGGQSVYFSDQTPIFTLTSSKTGSTYYDEDKFSVRNFYKINSGQVGLEVNDGLVLIDLNTRKANFITDQALIDNALKNAILISNDENEYHNQGRCGNDMGVFDRVTKEGYAFRYCLL